MKICTTEGCGKRFLAKGLCTGCYNKAAYAKNPEYKRQVKRDWVARNKDKVKALKREYSLFQAFGITQQDYLNMLAAQGNACAICRTTEPGYKNKTNFAVDHSHATRKVRGLLCYHCNLLIGFAKDKTTILSGAIDYLNNSEALSDSELERLLPRPSSRLENS